LLPIAGGIPYYRRSEHMSDRPRLHRNDPARLTPVRNWSNLFRGDGSRAPAAAQMNTPPEPTLVAVEPVSEEARLSIENAYRVIDEHLQEGRRAAEARTEAAPMMAPGAFDSAAIGSAGIGVATESIQEMVTQGIRFYASLAPLWTSVINSLANSPGTPGSSPNGSPATGTAAPLARQPLPRSNPIAAPAPTIIEVASTRMARVTVDLTPHANAAKLTTTGLHGIEPNHPPLTDISFTCDVGSTSHIVRIRVPDTQPTGVYNGVIVDTDSGQPRGTITLRLEEQ
jgi:hypothetical protein